MIKNDDNARIISPRGDYLEEFAAQELQALIPDEMEINKSRCSSKNKTRRTTTTAKSWEINSVEAMGTYGVFTSTIKRKLNLSHLPYNLLFFF